MKKTFDISLVDPLSFIGSNDKNIKLLENNFSTDIIVRGTKIKLDGDKNVMKYISLGKSKTIDEVKNESMPRILQSYNNGINYGISIKSMRILIIVCNDVSTKFFVMFNCFVSFSISSSNL